MAVSNDPTGPIDNQFHLAVVQAIHRAQTKLQWKPGKATQHLRKRIDLRHLPTNITQVEYEAIISNVLNDASAEVYVFLYGDNSYPTIVTTISNQVWLVMIGLDGIMETAFPPGDPEQYLADPAFEYIGMLQELQNE